MTIQEAFDKVWNWFVVQGKQRAVENGLCKLRTSHGLKCAIGVLIPDEQYDPAMDLSGTISNMLVYRKRVIPALEGLPVDFLSDLQQVHDHGMGGIEQGLTTLAIDYHLTIPETINTLDFKDKSDGQATHDSPQAVAGSVGMAPAGPALEPAGNPAATR